ncbi:MAG: GTPase HflX [Rhodanobacteraceae bacterium]|nr:GTPase HflX [Rhodanobacteraceae bacterium]
MEFFGRSKGGERALLVQPHPSGRLDPDMLAEFTELARSAGADIVDTLTARIDAPNSRFFLGTGKVEQLRELKEAHGADLVLVNAALSPVQERNLEKALNARVVDRTGLILDIFASRARTHEGKLQVELAQLKHLSTRLVRGWTHLERQRGGAIGLRGPGETQLELDRRMISNRVKALESRLDKVEVQRTQARRKRERGDLPVVTLVGYTNAGKSTLFNAITGAGVYAADQLFATLDPTLRKLDGLASGPAILADTVGFVRDLPHDLVAAFRSTLSEVKTADLLLHVVDASDPNRNERIEQVNAVLADIDAGDVPQLLVFNKIDRVPDLKPRRERIDDAGHERVFVSAIDGLGLELLRAAIGDRFAGTRVCQSILLGHDQARLRARLFEAGVVAAEHADDNGWKIDIDAPRAAIEPLFGLADGDGARLRGYLNLATPEPI